SERPHTKTPQTSTGTISGGERCLSWLSSTILVLVYRYKRTSTRLAFLLFGTRSPTIDQAPSGQYDELHAEMLPCDRGQFEGEGRPPGRRPEHPRHAGHGSRHHRYQYPALIDSH
ncbi:unnamed protein product, partial [Ascophyllum nodosum]